MLGSQISRIPSADELSSDIPPFTSMCLGETINDELLQLLPLLGYFTIHSPVLLIQVDEPASIGV